MRIAVVFRADYHEGTPVPCYAWSYVEAFREMGHDVWVVHDDQMIEIPNDWPHLMLEIENGRNQAGELRFNALLFGGACPKAVLLIDSHGHPDLHAEIAKSYDHVFFAVWARRDLFAGHPSAHWCPNATDLKWFGAERFAHITPHTRVGFFGSKKGLSRANDLVEACRAMGWSYDVRQVASNRNVNRWPATGEAMANCWLLFNRSQKHDGPNQRVMESMAMSRPLLCDVDDRDGMDKLFVPFEDYWPYTDRGSIIDGLALKLKPDEYVAMAKRARSKVESAHLIKHRAAQILEVVCNS